MNKQTIGCDWLEIFCRGVFSWELPPKSGFSFSGENVQTAMYQCGCNVYHDEKNGRIHAFFIMWCPRVSVMQPNSVHIKVQNAVLYSSKYIELLREFMVAYGLEYRGVSRIDLYADMNKCACGLHPRKLLERYLRQDILKIGNNKPLVNYSSLGYVMGAAAYRKDAPVNPSTPTVNAVTWGTHSSAVQAQCYNKSYEMKCVKEKPWIVDTWARAGLDIADVWRFEVRIKGKGKDLLRLDSGEIWEIGLDDIMTRERLEGLFSAYAGKYFRFVYKDFHVKRQHMKEVRIFRPTECIYSRPKFRRSGFTGEQGLASANHFLEATKMAIDWGMIEPPYERTKESIMDVQRLISMLYSEFRFFKPAPDRVREYYKALINSRLKTPLDTTLLDENSVSP